MNPISNMTPSEKIVDELLALKEERDRIDEQIKALMQNRRRQALAEIRKLVEQFEVTPEELAAIASGQHRAAASPKTMAHGEAKYRDPASGRTWTGRGKPPAWIAGQERSRFLIDKPELRAEIDKVFSGKA